MKRVLSLVLALVMVLGTLPMAFAADETAGEMLQAAGFVAGDENGNLMEENALTRAELAVLVAELNGVKENAKTYAIAPEFKDVKADDWFGPYVAYAAKEGWFKGDDEGNFNPTATVSDQTMATVMLRALGYEPAWDTAVSEAKAMGLPVDAASASSMTRGEAFSTMWGVVNTPKKESDVALGVELGKIEPAKEEVEELVATIDFVRAKGNGVLNVDFIGSVDAAAAGEVSNYTIVEKADTTKEIAVLSAYVLDGDDVILETEGLVSGKAYTLMVGDSKANFAGVAKDSDKPSIDGVKSVDDGEVEIEWEDANVDLASAQDVSNYTLEKEGTVVKAEVDADLNTVTLMIEGMVSTKSQKLFVENVMSVDGVVMAKENKTFAPDFDKSAPKIDEVEASDHNNTEVIITWTDDHGVDKATAEDVSNYSIDGLQVISAKAVYKDDDNDDYYKKVILTTEEQTKSKSYKLEVKYMVDGSNAANATTKVLSEKFRGGSEDKDEPKVKDITPRSLTEISVVYTEENALDPSTVLDASNYSFDDNEIDVVDVRFDDEDDNGNTYSKGLTGVDDMTKIAKDKDKIEVILTVTEMEEDESYKLRINNIADNYGNVMEDEETKSIKVKKEIKSYYQIATIKTTDLEKVVLTFEDKVFEASAEDPTNYVIDGIGAIKKAVLDEDDNKTVTLTVPELTIGKTYKLTVNNVENYWGYAAEDVVAKFIATNDEADTEQPEVDDVDYDNGELTVDFDEAMRAVEYNGTATNAYVIVKDKATPATYYRLDLVDKRDNNTVLVFNAHKAAGSGTAAASTNTTRVELPSNSTDFEIVKFGSVRDLSNNNVDYDENSQEFTTRSSAWSQTDKDDAFRVDGISQDSGNTVVATFDTAFNIGRTASAVVPPALPDPSGNATANTPEKTTSVWIPYYDGTTFKGWMEFTFEITGDDDEEITFTKKSGTFPDDSVELKFNFTEMIAVAPAAGATPSTVTKTPGTDVAVFDPLFRPVYSEDNDVDVDNDDDIEPVLEEVEAVDNQTVMLTYSEKLRYAGSYEIKYEDEDDDDKVVTIKSSEIKVEFDDEDIADVVKLTITNSKKYLKDQDYDLHYKSSPKDLANNGVDDTDDVTQFAGVATAKATEMVAAKVEGPLNIKFINDYEDFKNTSTAKTSFRIVGKDSKGNPLAG